MDLRLAMCRKKALALALFSIYFLSTDARGSFPALLAFGDSILDTGNNNFLLTFMKGNIWPYGKSWTMRIPTGRFGNGRVFSDIIAEGLGIKKVLPAYRKLFVPPSELKTGVCFASGGAGVDPVTSRLMRVLKPKDQVNDFKGYIRKLKATAGSSRAKDIVANAVILVSQGNNDIGISYFTTRSAIMRGMTAGRYTTKLAGWNKQFMKDLYDQGARKFAVMGVIPLGCLPMTRIGKGCCCMISSIVPCPNPDKYVFYDFVHPSEKSYKIISKKLVADIKNGLA
ncbi:PREDICTED: GDSL esterase/lipase EXL4-like [Camelina sativa]|uniref:GDSL esterase/lipase EXL4-like n=1 Tax=Camelina sativa TaxID=90675 RepID=A0ABM0WPT4_CAMSA|nr:PREDICTED: GDSL esterase/lipase EXL4-like [Camelina sativa]